MQYGVLLTCFKVNNSDKCIVRKLHIQVTENRPVLNEFHCPNLILTNDIYCIDPTQVSSAVSILHACGVECVLKTQTAHRRIERECISLESQLVLSHDLSNKLFLLNVYCS